MLALLAPLITRGVIDNTTPGKTALTLWCIDKEEPIEFLMEGNCMPDIAGCRVSFTNKATAPAEEDYPALRQLREYPRGHVVIGDITLSLREPEVNNRHYVSNILSIEFFVNRTTRVLIESHDFTFDISLPQWQISWGESNLQGFLNMETLRDHVVSSVEQFRSPGLRHIQGLTLPACSWDMRLNRAEANMAIYPSIRRKYMFRPNGALSLAYVMGRYDILERKAAEDEAHLPPEQQADCREWDVLDFVEPTHADSVRAGMGHPLFQESAHLTNLVQKHLISKGGDFSGEFPEGHQLGDFLNLYAGMVSYLLATILLTQQPSYSRSMAAQRIQLLQKQVVTLTESFANLCPEHKEVFERTAAAMSSRLEEFFYSIT